MTKLTLFKTFTTKQLKAADDFFIEGGAAKVAVRFENFIANHIVKGFETGDTRQFDKVLQGARQFGRFRWIKGLFCSISVGAEFSQGLIPYEYSTESEAFTGKANAEKLAALRAMSEYKQTDGTTIAVPFWEKLLRMALDNEAEAEKVASKTEFRFGMRVTTLIKAGRDHGNSEIQMKAAFDNALQTTRPAASPSTRKAA